MRQSICCMVNVGTLPYMADCSWIPCTRVPFFFVYAVVFYACWLLQRHYKVNMLRFII